MKLHPPDTSGMGKKARKRAIKEWKNSLSADEIKQWEWEYNQSRVPSDTSKNSQSEKTTSGFTKDELNKIDWSNT